MPFAMSRTRENYSDVHTQRTMLSNDINNNNNNTHGTRVVMMQLFDNNRPIIIIITITIVAKFKKDAYSARLFGLHSYHLKVSL